MSYLWSFNSYPQDRFDSLVGSRPTLSEEHARTMLEWDESLFDDPGLAGALAKHLSASGLSYATLGEREARALDSAVPVLFSPEGLEQELALEYESPDGVHPTVFKELLERSTGAGLSVTLLPVFVKGGRRAGSSSAEPPPCEYCLLDPTEVAALLHEIQASMDVAGQWSEGYVPDVVRECLLDVLDRVRAKGRAAIAVLG